VRERRQKPGQYGSGSVYRRASDGRWVGSFLVDGRRFTVTATTEPQARKLLIRKQGEVARDGAPDPGVSNRATVKGYADVWIRHQQTRLRPKTLTAYRSSINQAINPAIGHRKLVALTPADLRAVAAYVKKAGRTSTTAKHAHRVLILILKAATLEGIAVPQRVLLTEAPRTAINDRQEIPTPEARALLRTAANDHDASRWVAALLQGMRQAECLGLTWQCVNLRARTIDVSWQLARIPYADRDAGTFRVPEGYESRHLYKTLHLVRTKTAAGQRIIPIVGFMWDALVEWASRDVPSPYGLVWPSMATGPRIPAGRPMTSREDTEAWWALQDRAQTACVVGTQGRRWLLHEARHSAATLLLDAGVDPKTVTQIMGHSSIAVSRGYMHVSQDLARKALESGADRLGLN
jgi:integrase